MNNVAFLDYQHYYVDQKNDTGAFSYEVRQWGYAIALPIVGLLMLYVFLSLGGAFAFLGPWTIFIAVRLITSRWDEKVCKFEITNGQICNVHTLTEFNTSKRFQ